MTQWMIHVTESFLSYRKYRKKRREEKRKGRSKILLFLYEFLWAIGVVFLINQLVLQAYVIPTGSMIPVFALNDRIFVEKVTFGPVLIPYFAKIPSIRAPKRGEIVVFQNPSYRPQGSLFTIIQRFLHLLSLGTVNIDRDRDGQIRAELLVKRVVGLPGDSLRYEQGKVYLSPAGTDAWFDEREIMRFSKTAVNYRESDEDKELLEEYIALSARADYGILDIQEQQRLEDFAVSQQIDPFFYGIIRHQAGLQIAPYSVSEAMRYKLYSQGWHVGQDQFFPMGDNRDNSRDARFFGAVDNELLIGRPLFRFFPFNRFGSIE